MEEPSLKLSPLPDLSIPDGKLRHAACKILTHDNIRKRKCRVHNCYKKKIGAPLK